MSAGGSLGPCEEGFIALRIKTVTTAVHLVFVDAWSLLGGFKTNHFLL